MITPSKFPTTLSEGTVMPLCPKMGGAVDVAVGVERLGVGAADVKGEGNGLRDGIAVAIADFDFGWP